MVKTNIYFPFIAINLYHSTFLRNADPDFNENSGGSTDLDQQIARIGGFPYPYSPLSDREYQTNVNLFLFPHKQALLVVACIYDTMYIVTYKKC